MEGYTPMGFYPSGSGHGYEKSLVRRTSTHDYYKLSTQIWYILYDANGVQVAPANNPIYHSCQMYNISNLLFRYQYIIEDWQ
jgi:hypothetical protein